MKIILINIFAFFGINIKNLATYLNANGHKAYCIFFKDTKYTTNVNLGPTNKEYELLLRKIEEIRPNIVGISQSCASFKGIVKELINRLRVTKLPIIIGGIAPTINPEDYIDFVDYLCVGEAEYALLELLNCLESGKEPEHIKGLWYKKDNQIIKNNEMRLTDIQKLPLPVLKEVTYIDDNSYKSLDKYRYSVYTSRGCPNSCTYCANSFLRSYYSKCGKWLRRRNVDSVIEELSIVKKEIPELEFVHFLDDDFLWDYEWVKKFCKEYKEKINLPFWCLGTFNNCDEKRANLITDAGCKYLGLGIQSGSERIRKEVFNRGAYTNEDIINTSKMLSKFKILQRYDIITDNPFETKQDKEETLKILLSLKKPFTLELFSLTFFPNYPITKMALEKKLIKEEDIEGTTDQQDVHNWKIDLSLVTNKEDIFYGSMLQLIDTITPRIIIKLIAKIGFFRKHPRLLGFSRYMRQFNHFLDGLKVHRRIKFTKSTKVKMPEETQDIKVERR